MFLTDYNLHQYISKMHTTVPQYKTHSSPRQLMIITIYLKCKIILFEVLHQEKAIRTEITMLLF